MQLRNQVTALMYGFASLGALSYALYNDCGMGILMGFMACLVSLALLKVTNVV